MLDALDEDFEGQVEDVTLDPPESGENLKIAGNDVKVSDILSLSMSYYYLYTCMLSNLKKKILKVKFCIYGIIYHMHVLTF